MINHFQNPYLSILSDKWHFDSNQNWKTLAFNFDSFSTNVIADKTLRAISFHISATRYLKKEYLHFINITDLKLNTKPAIINNLDQVVIDFEEEIVKKKNKHAAKRKEQFAKLCIPIRSLLFAFFESLFFLSSRSMSALMPAFMPTPMPAFVLVLMPTSISCFGSFTVLFSYCISAPVSYLDSPLSYCLVILLFFVAEF